MRVYGDITRLEMRAMTLYIGKTLCDSSVDHCGEQLREKMCTYWHIYQVRLELTLHHLILQQMTRDQLNQLGEKFRADRKSDRVGLSINRKDEW